MKDSTSPSQRMSAPRPLFEDFVEAEPPTLNGPGLGEAGLEPPGQWALIRYSGVPVGEVLLLGPEGLSLGRASENQVRLPEPEISRHHARLELVSQKGLAPMVLLSDLGSTNGTFVNGRVVLSRQGPAALRHGDVVRLGPHAFKLKHLDTLEKHYHEAVLAQATVDPLTCLHNRGAVLRFLDQHTDLARRYRRPLAIILCDLDHFKEINDHYGHAAGDLALRTFGAVVCGRLRASDLVGRIGGEEFLVVLPETGGGEAMTVAEGLRAALAAEPIPVQGGPDLRITCCFGVVEHSPVDPDGGAMLARADLALYRAKALGRNRVEFDGSR
jgi:diguanylate cyclase (GGDEF)-like protein